MLESVLLSLLFISISQCEYLHLMKYFVLLYNLNWKSETDQRQISKLAQSSEYLILRREDFLIDGLISEWWNHSVDPLTNLSFQLVFYLSYLICEYKILSGLIFWSVNLISILVDRPDLMQTFDFHESFCLFVLILDRSEDKFYIFHNFASSWLIFHYLVATLEAGCKKWKFSDC